MEWVKTTAKTLPEAIDLALDNLGVDESEAEIVVLEEPRPGLFGRMRGTARVEARVKPKPIRPKNERNRNRRNRSDDGGGGGGRNRNRNRNRNRGKGRGDGGDRSGGGGRDGGRAGEADRNDQARDGGDQRGGDGGQRGGRNRNRNRSRNRGRGQGDQDRQQGGRSDERRQSAPVGGRGGHGANGGGAEGSAQESAQAMQGAAVEDVATHLETFLTDLNDAFGFDSGVTIDDSEEGTLVGRIEGRHGLLVGPKGRTLDAVQELARISCQRTAPSNIRIKVDVGGYREQRAAALADFARKAADRAIDEGAEVALEPMSPADRKSVHDALNGDDRVETRSVGSEPRRRVVVVPLDVDDDDDDLDDTADANGAAPAADDGLTEVEDVADANTVDDDE